MKLKEELDSIADFIEPVENIIIKNRLNHLLEWYVKKATYYKCAYYAMSVIIIVINASIPIMNQIELKLTISIASAVASILGSVIALFSFKDTWFRYRKHVELIKQQCIFYNMKSGAYKDKDRDEIFINAVEGIISSERELWEMTRFNKEAEEESK